MMPMPSQANNERVTNNETKSVSPSSSPRSSPRPSPQPEIRHEHSVSVNINTPRDHGFKHEGSPSSQESSTSRLSTGSSLEPSPSSDLKSDPTSKDKKDSARAKKKSSWFNSLYPTYKSRSEDFKKLFPEVPTDERLVVDYSCALQKEILVQGRLYITQNYLCFYANIFGWETNQTLKWKDVAAITKEKTALVIPNAVLICTKSDKYFFTSLVQRDKTYLMLFRIWQNALMDQPMSQQEMWTWVHQCYGSELGLTSDDEDYRSPSQDEEKLSTRLSVDSFSEVEVVRSLECVMDNFIGEDKMEDLKINIQQATSTLQPSSDKQHHTTSEHSETESDKPISMKGADFESIECTSLHEGKLLLDEVYPIHIDQLFTLLFTSSKFYLDFHASRKTSDLTQTPWTHNPLDNSKSRVVNLTMSLGQTMGPKTCQVTERHTMLPCSKSGSLYSVDIETVNAGVPYADSFYVVVHYCLKKVSDTHSSIHVTGQLKFKKNVWGLVKGMIERNVWSGLEDFFCKLKEALQTEGEENVPEQRKKSRRKRRLHTLPKYSLEDVRSNAPRKKLSTGSIFSTDVCTVIVLIVLIILVILNVLLYLKLWSLEEGSSQMRLMDLRSLKHSPKSHDEWIQLLQHQESARSVEAQKWQKTLKRVVGLLREAEEALEDLQKSIHPNYMSKVIDAMQDSVEGDSKDTKREL